MSPKCSDAPFVWEPEISCANLTGEGAIAMDRILVEVEALVMPNDVESLETRSREIAAYVYC